MLFNGKVLDEQETDSDVKVRKFKVLFAKNTNDETTHQTTADKAETILNSK